MHVAVYACLHMLRFLRCVPIYAWFFMSASCILHSALIYDHEATLYVYTLPSCWCVCILIAMLVYYFLQITSANLDFSYQSTCVLLQSSILPQVSTESDMLVTCCCVVCTIRLPIVIWTTWSVLWRLLICIDGNCMCTVGILIVCDYYCHCPCVVLIWLDCRHRAICSNGSALHLKLSFWG